MYKSGVEGTTLVIDPVTQYGHVNWFTRMNESVGITPYPAYQGPHSTLQYDIKLYGLQRTSRGTIAARKQYCR